MRLPPVDCCYFDVDVNTVRACAKRCLCKCFQTADGGTPTQSQLFPDGDAATWAAAATPYASANGVRAAAKTVPPCSDESAVTRASQDACGNLRGGGGWSLATCPTTGGGFPLFGLLRICRHHSSSHFSPSLHGAAGKWRRGAAE